jgi:hypothetical protein
MSQCTPRTTRSGVHGPTAVCNRSAKRLTRDRPSPRPPHYRPSRRHGTKRALVFCSSYRRRYNRLRLTPKAATAEGQVMRGEPYEPWRSPGSAWPTYRLPWRRVREPTARRTGRSSVLVFRCGWALSCDLSCLVSSAPEPTLPASAVPASPARPPASRLGLRRTGTTPPAVGRLTAVRSRTMHRPEPPVPRSRPCPLPR